VAGFALRGPGRPGAARERALALASGAGPGPESQATGKDQESLRLARIAGVVGGCTVGAQSHQQIGQFLRVEQISCHRIES
jgi:hypothetical protein